MPVRFLNSPVLIWPDRKSVLEALQRWAQDVAQRRPDVLQVGYFGSYARGDWGVGSDLDVILIVEGVEAPFERRAVGWGLTSVPLPVDVLVYTPEEWGRLAQHAGFGARVAREIVWVFRRAEV